MKHSIENQKSPQIAAPASPADDWKVIPSFKNLPVGRLVSWEGNELDSFIVFLDRDGDLDWKANGRFETVIASDEGSAIICRITELEAVPVSHLSEEKRIAFLSMLGQALVQSLRGQNSTAQSQLLAASDFVTIRNREVARSWLLIATASALLVVLVLAAILWVNRDGVAASFGALSPSLVLAGAAGATGAFVSLATRVTTIPLDPNAGKFIHGVEGSIHVLLGVIGGVIVFFAMKSDIFLPKLLEFQNVGIGLGCFIGGASERTIRTLLQKSGSVDHGRRAKRNHNSDRPSNSPRTKSAR